MNFRLILKQSYQYFKSKSPLYLTFIPFLILAVSLIVGMFSFANNFRFTYNQALGNYQINFKLYLERPFKPAWVADSPVDYYLVQEKENPETQQGYFYEFMTNLWEKDSSPLSEKEYQLLILGLGYFHGEANQLSVSNLFTNDLLKKYFEVDNPEQMDEHLKTYNQEAEILGWKIYELYQTNNLVIGYFLDFIQKDHAWLGYSMKEYWNAEFVSPSIQEKIYWQHLRVSSDLIPNDPTFYQQTPWTLKTNPAIPYQMQKQVDWKNYPDFLKNRNFVYFSPKFLHENNLKVGQIISLNFDLTVPDQPVGESLEDTKGQEFLIAGSLVSASNFDKKKPIFFIPYQWITKYYQEHHLMPRNVRGRLYAHLQEFGNDYQAGQNFAAKMFNDRFTNLVEPGVPLENETEWVGWLPSYVYHPTVVLFLVLAYFVTVLMTVLLVIVFYFITKQIVDLQKQTLMFLKSLGVSNHKLSVLITATLVIPLIAALIGGFFGGLIIQQVTANLAFTQVALYWDYFNFSPTFFLVWILAIFVLMLIFYVTNWILIKKQKLTASQGYQIVKTSSRWWTKRKLNLPDRWSPKFKIGLSFVFKNLTQNLITYLLLSVTFSITLYAVQFKTSLQSLGRSYEKWNKPYQSVNYNPQLYLYSPLENQRFLRTYQARTKIDDLQPINTFEEWNNYFDQYLETVEKGTDTFDWQNYYLTKDFSLQLLALINDQEKFNQLVKDLQEKLQEKISDPKIVDQILNIFLSLIEQVKTKVSILNQELKYDQGFNLYFGQTPLLPNTRNVWTSEGIINNSAKPLTLIAFEQQDFASQKHFGFSQFREINDYLMKKNNGQNYLKVNISNYLATKNGYSEGQVFDFKVKGLKSSLTSEDFTIPIFINKIVQDNNVTSEIYTCQEALIYFLTKSSKLDDQARITYQNLFTGLTNKTDEINNSSYDQNSRVPWGIQNLTLPLYHASQDKPGTRIEDFYDSTLSSKYFGSLGTEIFIFNQVSQEAFKSSAQFMQILNLLIIIFILLAIIISAILTNLILFENQRIIILLKSMGYRRREVQWYLIGGYLIATLLAVGTAIGLSFLIFDLTKKILTESLGFSIYFIWSWQYLLTFIGLGLIFWLIVKVTINLFTDQQKPTNLFAEN